MIQTLDTPHSGQSALHVQDGKKYSVEFGKIDLGSYCTCTLSGPVEIVMELNSKKLWLRG